jgi:NAD(P)-dependent dehydrogenase (short-subunit alcohol dehydrogenase family)
MELALDGIIANAGIMALPKLEQRHGYELQFFTNHVGHFILVTGLLEGLAEDGRVVMLSSRAHERAPKEGIQFDNLSGEKGYSPWTAYGQSKLANLLFARSLAKRLPNPKQTANAVHPGVIATNLGRHMSSAARRVMSLVEPLFLKSIPEGTATQLYVAAHPDADGISGEYWADCNVAESTDHGLDLELAERLWEETEGIVAGWR